ncbi:MAG: InlB B-repeat-containing protein, partial [Mogibacterium sp.]|nr:InlB B-repeat-containing protein [Mogibacterium sp.]
MKRNDTLKRFLAFLLCVAMMITYMPSPVYTLADEDADQPAVAQEESAPAETKAEDPAPATEPAEEPAAPADEPAPVTEKAETPDVQDETAPTDDKESAEDAVEETTEDPEAAEVPEEEIVEEPEEGVEYPAQSFSDTVGGVKVSVEAPEGALPEGTTAHFKAVPASAVEDAVKAEMGGNAEVVKAVDITFKNKDGKEIEPLKSISVKFVSREFKKIEDAAVVHIDDGEATKVADGLVDTYGKTVEFDAKDFSIYVVVDSGDTQDDSRLHVIFKSGETEIASMYVKKGDNMPQVLYDPGVPYADNKVFDGWTTDEHYTFETKGKTIETVRSEVSEMLEEGVEEGESVTYYAVLFTAYRVTYEDEGGIAFKIDTFRTTTDSAEATIDTKYAVSSQTQGFVGWKEKGTETPVYRNGTTIEITADKTLVPVITEGHWLHFDENDGGAGTGNASYTPPAFIQGGTPCADAEPEDPTRPGYNFLGWFTSASGGSLFNFNSELSANTTIYAHWEAKTETKYQIAIWKQNVNDDKDATEKTYDFVESVSLTAASGTTINDALVSANLPSGYSLADIKNGKNTLFTYAGWDVSGGDSGKINGNGQTVINVRYDRALFTIEFYGSRTGTSPNYSYNNLQYSFTGLYEQPLSKYDYQWPSGVWTSVAYLSAFSGTLFGHSDLGNTGNLIKTFPRNNSSTEQLVTIYYYTQKLDEAGSYDIAATSQYYMTSSAGYNITNRFTGMTSSGYAWSDSSSMPSSWNSATDVDSNGITKEKRGTRTYLHIKYDRVVNDLVFINGTNELTDSTISDIPYEKPLAGYKNQAPTIDPEDEEHYFVGWYEDETLQTPFNWSTAKMGSANKVLYAKIAPVEYHVIIDPKGGEVDPRQSLEFWPPYGTVIDDSYLSSATWGGEGNYSLVGWYTDEEYTKPWNFSARITSDSLSIKYEGPEDSARVDYGDDGYDNVVGVFTLYAKWRDDSIAELGGLTIEYVNPDGAPAYSYEDPTKYADQAEVHVAAGPTNTYWPENKQFVGWKLSETTYSPASTFTADKNDAVEVGNKLVITLTAVYEDKGTHTPTHIYWYKNYGDETNPEPLYKDENLKINQNVELSSHPVPTRPGYIFNGWIKDTENTTTGKTNKTERLVKYSNGAYDKSAIAADEEPPYEAMYASWEVNDDATYTVTYEAQTGGSVTPESQSDQVLSNSKITGSKAAAADGYAFDGWYK